MLYIYVVNLELCIGVRLICIYELAYRDRPVRVIGLLLWKGMSNISSQIVDSRTRKLQRSLAFPPGLPPAP